MSWIKFEHTTPDKPEVISMATLLHIDQDAVVGKLLRLWIWADQNSVAGASLAVTDAFIDRITKRKGFAAAMRVVGWLVGEAGSLSFNNFDRHNGATAKARAETNRRVAKHRKCNAGTVTNVTPAPLRKPLPDKIREDKKESSTPPPDGVEVVKAATKPRERNPLIDALATVGGGDPAQVPASRWPSVAKCLRDLKEVCPDLSVAEISRRAGNYRTHFRDAILTPEALSKHWATCEKTGSHVPASEPGARYPGMSPDDPLMQNRTAF